MIRKPLFGEMFALLATVGILNYIATVNHLYWSTSGFDSMVHFFGGATLSAFFLWLYFFSGIFAPPKRSLWQFIFVAIVGSLFVAISWEIYELLLGEAKFGKSEYPLDTTMDIIMDLLGIVAACFYGYFKEIKALENKTNGQS